MEEFDCIFRAQMVTSRQEFAEKVSRVWVSAVNVLRVNVKGQTNEEPPKFTISFEGAMLQASESNESRCENFEVNLKWKMFSRRKLVLPCYKTIGSWFQLCVYRVMDKLQRWLNTQCKMRDSLLSGLATSRVHHNSIDAL